jgi:hypothetical protein
MQPQEYKVVYDILQEGYLALSWFVILWFLGSAVMSVVFFMNLKANKFKIEGMNDSLGVVILPIFLIVGVLGIFSTLYTQCTCISWAKSSDTQIIHGQIKNLMTEAKYETFTVNGTRFEHREADLTKCGYTQAKGIKLENNKSVRITYHEGCILKLEVAE